MKLGIYGTGGSGREVFEMVNNMPEFKSEWDEIVFIDDTKDCGMFLDCRMMPFEVFCSIMDRNAAKVVIAVGEPKNRKLLYDRVKDQGYELETIVDSSVRVFHGVTLGEGAIIKEGVFLSSDAYIGDNVYINGGATIIGHDVEIGAHCQISSNSVVAGYTKVGACSFIGIGAAVRDHIEIGENCIISMGAVVMKTVSDNKIVMGNPAREIAENNERKVFK